MAAKNIIIRKLVGEQLHDLMPKTVFAQVFDGTGKTLEQFATDVAAKIDTKADLTAFNALKASFDNLVADAPQTYDTLREIGEYLTTHQDEYEALCTIAAGKVDKVDGKQLSTEDFTTELKTKLEKLYDKATLDSKFEAVQTTLDGHTASINLLNAGNTTVGSVDYKIKTAIDGLGVADLSGKVQKNTTDIAAINDQTTGIYANAVKYTDQKAAETLTTAKSYTDEKIAGTAKVILSTTQPAGLRENDIWFQELV